MKTECSKVIPQIILFIFVLGVNCCAWGASWTVGPTGDYATIQAAINAASAGDTINVPEGIYSEQIIMNKTGITLEGETNKYPAICGPCGTTGGRGVINIGANNITIKGLEVYDSDGVYSYDTAAIWGNWGGAKHNLTVKDCIIHNAHRGVAFSGSNVTIMGCNIYSNQDNGIYCSSDGSFTPYPFLVISNWIHSDALDYPGGGSPKGCSCISIRYANRYGRVAYNYLSSYRYGIRQDYNIGSAPGCGQILIEHNTFDGPAPSFMPDYTGIYTQRYGIFGNDCALSTNTIIRNNIFANLLGPGMYYLKNGGNASIICSNNLFYNCNRTYHYSDTYWYPSEGDATNAVANWHAVDANSFQFPGSYPNSDPIFVYTGTTAASYWALAAGSPALNAASDGTHIGAYQGPPVTRPAMVTLYNLSQVYDGTVRLVTNTTDPAGLTVEITYDGSTSSPTNAGSYAVTGTVTTLPYEGSATGTLEVAKANQTITFPAIADQLTTNQVGLAATALSGLQLTFTTIGGPATIIDDTNLSFTGTGLVSIAASQEGDQNWNAAANVTNTFIVRQPDPDTGTVIIRVTPTDGTWVLINHVSQISGSGNFGPTNMPIGTYNLQFKPLTGGYVTPPAQTQVVTPNLLTKFEGIYLQISTNIGTPEGVSATDGTYTNKIRVTWQEVAGAVGYEVWRSQTNDPTTAGQIADIPENSPLLLRLSGGRAKPLAEPLSIGRLGRDASPYLQDTPKTVYAYDDYNINQISSYYYWVRAKTTTLISPMSYVGMGYAGLNPAQTQGTADIAVSDLVFLPVNVTNGSHAGTVSCRLQNNGPDILSDAEMEFNFYMGTNATGMAWIGSNQTNMTLNAGEESLVILTPQARRALTVRGDLIGIQQVKVTVRHLSALNDPNLANNTTNAAGLVRIKTSGVNSPGRSANDYDGDGKSDLALWHVGNYLWVFRLSGQRYQSVINQYFDAGDCPVPGDYDGDGVTDMAIWCRLNGWWNVLFSSTKQVGSAYFFGRLEFTATQCDFDGDAKTDPVVYRETDGYWEGAASSRQYVLCSTYLGETGYQPVMADYDGDGLADPAVYNRTTGLWDLALSGNGYQIVTGGYGGLGYLPVSADYDGDGRVDFGLYEYATGWWYVLMSNRSTGPIGQGYREASGQLGAPYGMPAVADYDGDGLADPTVYHIATGLWQIYFSSQGYACLSGGFGSPQYQPVTE